MLHLAWIYDESMQVHLQALMGYYNLSEFICKVGNEDFSSIFRFGQTSVLHLHRIALYLCYISIVSIDD